jgi:DNA-directed RNA polymerase specialized sigma24 family protein
MKKEKYFCDFCKKELTKKNQPKRQPKLPMWVTTIANFLNGEEETFENFAIRICVKRRIWNEIDSSIKRQKSIPLNTALSLNTPITNNNLFSDKSHPKQILSDLLQDSESDPLKILLKREEKTAIKNNLYYDLTQLESSVLEGYEKGESYKEIAKNLKITVKCVDNSLGRIRKKANKIFDENNETTSISTVIYRSKKRKGDDLK